MKLLCRKVFTLYIQFTTGFSLFHYVFSFYSFLYFYTNLKNQWCFNYLVGYILILILRKVGLITQIQEKANLTIRKLYQFHTQ